MLYTVAVRCPSRTSAPATAVLAGCLTLVLVFGPVEPTLTDWFVNVVVLLTAWSLGRSVRGRRAYTAGLEERNRALVAAREARLEAVTASERARIAREMQDLVAHGLTAMTVQAAAARRVPTGGRSPASPTSRSSSRAPGPTGCRSSSRRRAARPSSTRVWR